MTTDTYVINTTENAPINVAETEHETDEQTLPGDVAIWIFILAELLVFGIFFLAYAITRLSNIELFNESQLNLTREYGAINTAVLITGSYFVVLAVNAIRQNKAQQCGRWLLAALATGTIFTVIKCIEFYEKFSEGINLSTNVFYMFYLSLTFFHFMHVLLGMVILAAVYVKNRQGAYTAKQHMGVETGAAYWHMVDLVWIILFPLVYLLH